MTLTVGSLYPQNNSGINLASGTVLQQQGAVIQTVWLRTDTRSTYSAPNSGNGTAITPLRLTITPKRSDSWIWLRWVVFHEMHHDTVLLVHQNGSLIGYNTQRGNVRWSGIYTPPYDNDYSSTPHTATVNWFVKAGSTSSRYYDLACRSSSSGNYTFALNRTNGSAGQDSYEAGFSYGWAREICG